MCFHSKKSSIKTLLPELLQPFDLNQVVSDIEQDYIKQALKKTNDKIGEAETLLGVNKGFIRNHLNPDKTKKD